MNKNNCIPIIFSKQFNINKTNNYKIIILRKYKNQNVINHKCKVIKGAALMILMRRNNKLWKCQLFLIFINQGILKAKESFRWIIHFIASKYISKYRRDSRLLIIIWIKKLKNEKKEAFRSKTKIKEERSSSNRSRSHGRYRI